MHHQSLLNNAFQKYSKEGGQKATTKHHLKETLAKSREGQKIELKNLGQPKN
jgi:hypothetical protein